MLMFGFKPALSQRFAKKICIIIHCFKTTFSFSHLVPATFMVWRLHANLSVTRLLLRRRFLQDDNNLHFKTIGGVSEFIICITCRLLRFISQDMKQTVEVKYTEYWCILTYWLLCYWEISECWLILMDFSTEVTSHTIQLPGLLGVNICIKWTSESRVRTIIDWFPFSYWLTIDQFVRGINSKKIQLSDFFQFIWTS